jgi:4-hydroxythreonine-4-phosphate dehydrogenase
MSRIVFTCGDINGIGPEIAIKTLNKLTSQKTRYQFILIIPENVFEKTSKLVKPTFNYVQTDEIRTEHLPTSNVFVLTLNSYNNQPGKPTKASGEASYLALKKSFGIIKDDLGDAVVTAPVSKTALKMAGSKYPGQTEMFADWSGAKTFVMTFLSKSLLVGLYSIHIPLKEVSKTIKTKEFTDKLRVLISMLRDDLGISKPRIAVLGLNPHSGEGGIIGVEEKNLITPAIQKLKSGSSIQGPFSADAFFANRKFKKFDLVFGFYHDQVLIPFKYINAGRGVNYTAGLPIIRTSPDHGVAYDIAGKGIADASSMLEAFKYAKLIVKNRNKVAHKSEV